MQDGTPTNLQKPVAELTISREAAGKGEANRSLARLAPWLAWSLWALSIVFGALTLLLAYANSAHPVFPRAPLIPWFVPALAMFPTIGALVASRHPRNPIGWTFLAVGLALFGLFAEQYAGYTLVTQPGALPGGLLMAWTSAWTSSLGILVMLTFTFLLFPTGRLPSPRWRPVAWASGALITLYCVWLAIKPGPILVNVPASRNPVGVEQAAGAIGLIDGLFMLIFVLTILTSITSLIERFLHARGEERQQLKWIAYAGGLTITLFACLAILQLLLNIRERMVQYREVAGAVAPVAGFALAAFPVAVGIAILRHHLFNIDLIINRTLVYVPLTAILAGLYSASISFFQKLFVAVTGESSDAAIVLTTLAVAASFTPVKNWLQAVVDTRFKEAPDPAGRLSAFAEQVKASYSVLDPTKVTLRLLDEAAQAFEAQTGVLYLQRDGHMERAHTYGDWQDGDAEISAPIEYNGTHAGLIRLGARKHGHEYTDRDRQTLQKAAAVVAEAIGSGEYVK